MNNINNIIIGESMSRGEITNKFTSSQSKPKWKRCLRKSKLLAAKTIQAIVPINWRVKSVDKQEINRLERCDVGYQLIEKRKGIHPIVQVLEPECEQDSAVTQVSDCLGLASEDINRSEIETLSVQITQEERDKSAETDLQKNGFGLLKSEFKDLDLKENPKSALIVFDFLKAHRDWKLISDRADTEDGGEISSLSGQSLFPTGADQIGDEGIELRRTPDFETLSINFSIVYSDWLLVSECADIQDKEEITTVIDLSLLFDADKDQNKDIESVEKAIPENSVAKEEKVLTKDNVETSQSLTAIEHEEPLDTVVNRLLASYPIQRPKVGHALHFESMAHSFHPSNKSEPTVNDTYGHNEEPLDSVVDRLLDSYPMQKPDVNLKFITDKKIPSAKEGNATDNQIVSGNVLDKTEEEVHFYYSYASNFHWNFSFIDRNRLFGRGLK